MIKTGDLNTLTIKMIRKQLEGEFGVKLKHRKEIIKSTIDDYMDNLTDSEDEAAEAEAQARNER